jgi:hypothetical protein
MLHLCNITTGVWGRYAGEDTRPFDANSQRRVVILQRCTKNGVYQICNTHVAHLQQHMQKKSGGISAPAILFCSLSHFDNEHLFGLYRKWFTQCCCVVACPNNVKRCACDVFFLP